ncbi:NAD(P)(+) transhydrogenase (Re/Si-specific) subunit beta [Streptomyces sp. NPDC096311]|uniref:NAD(P)(+) transhydrogenase (Re/Si-specific) subunit beta n=1 Tax=Streptomyces sp. NPDC096311 TaxID=3366083 RepID=UPI003800D33E
MTSIDTEVLWEAADTVVFKRSMAAGYTGVQNPQFFRDTSQVLFGDAKTMVEEVLARDLTAAVVRAGASMTVQRSPGRRPRVGVVPPLGVLPPLPVSGRAITSIAAVDRTRCSGRPTRGRRANSPARGQSAAGGRRHRAARGDPRSTPRHRR